MANQGTIKRFTLGFFTVMIMATAVVYGQSGATILKPAELQKLLPPSVFYHGQTATIQLRNSAGVRFADGHFVLATMVDTSGYSTAIAALYQAQLITEIPIQVGGKPLPAGVYGIGFVAGDKLVVTDIGGHQVMTAATATDAELQRPRPLEILPDPSGGFRLYAGRRYVVFTR